VLSELGDQGWQLYVEADLLQDAQRGLVDPLLFRS
jgi:hypothetical protein